MLLFNDVALCIERADKIKEDSRKEIEQLFKLFNRQLITLDEFSSECQKVAEEQQKKLTEVNRDMVNYIKHFEG